MSIFNNISSILFIILMLVFNLSFYKFFFFFLSGEQEGHLVVANCGIN